MTGWRGRSSMMRYAREGYRRLARFTDRMFKPGPLPRQDQG